jgi:16S rRNA (adenine1518-N6/adenine1519-N6)-dimethyltransferase
LASIARSAKKVSPLFSVQKKLRSLKIRPTKRRGQHFVIDPGVIRRMLAAASLEPKDVVLEIGAGMGSLTFPLAEHVERVYAVEIDPRLARVLQEEKGDNPRIDVIQGDALTLDIPSLAEKWDRKLKVVANLPYEISSPMIFRLFEFRNYFSLWVLMFQREVAERIVASPGRKDYGPLSIWTRLYTHAQILFRVPPGAFSPRPKVDSAVVKMVVLDPPFIPLKNKELLERVVRSAFSYRRKMIANALKLGDFHHLPMERIIRILTSSGIDPHLRGEKLTLEQFCSLCEAIDSNGSLRS